MRATRKQQIDLYLQKSIKCIEAIRKGHLDDLSSLIVRLESTREAGGSVFLVGNGGSASTASHFACDLNKTAILPEKRRFRAQSLVDNMPTLLAWANDTSYSNVFAAQLPNHAVRGDLLIAISGSGNSSNVLNAVRAAKKIGMYTIGLTGFSGGRLRGLADECIAIPSDSMYRTEDMHLMTNHIIVSVFRREI